jgi:hypothetical protein
MDGGLQTPTTLRPIRPLTLRDIDPGMAEAGAPEFLEVDPRELVVDDAYQRGLSERSITLIRTIVTVWDWRRFKPPIVSRRGEQLVVIDGQHTAIAAATHPQIHTIPVMVVAASDQAAEAQAFVGHNRDRVALTTCQIHFAALAAGDERARHIDAAARGAGVKILRLPPRGGVFKPGDCMAVAVIGRMVERHGSARAADMLRVLVEADLTPVSQDFIKAVEVLMTEAEYAGAVTPKSITAAIVAIGQEGARREAGVFAAAHDVPLWRGLVVVLFRRARRGR